MKKKIWIELAICFVIVVAGFIYLYFNANNCIQWDGPREVNPATGELRPTGGTICSPAWVAIFELIGTFSIIFLLIVLIYNKFSK